MAALVPGLVAPSELGTAQNPDVDTWSHHLSRNPSVFCQVPIHGDNGLRVSVVTRNMEIMVQPSWCSSLGQEVTSVSPTQPRRLQLMYVRQKEGTGTHLPEWPIQSLSALVISAFSSWFLS
jgi:hypothetical protein